MPSRRATRQLRMYVAAECPYILLTVLISFSVNVLTLQNRRSSSSTWFQCSKLLDQKECHQTRRSTMRELEYSLTAGRYTTILTGLQRLASPCMRLTTMAINLVVDLTAWIGGARHLTLGRLPLNPLALGAPVSCCISIWSGTQHITSTIGQNSRCGGKLLNIRIWFH